MMRFLLKGIIRDRHRSLFPVIIILLGVMITVLLYCYINGVADDFIRSSAKLDTGHVKIMTRAYAEIAEQAPNDLAVSGVDESLSELRRRYPQIDWAPRIKFGGLVDIPDENGETRTQGPVIGLALDLIGPQSKEIERMNLNQALVAGRLPSAAGEIIISDQYAKNLKIQIGETATLIGATADGAMAIQNFIVAGTVRFGVGAMDRNAMIAGLRDIQYALDMADAAGEILGFFPNMIYDDEAAMKLAAEFNAGYDGNQDEFAPVMITLKEHAGLGEYVDLMNSYIFIFVFIFVLVMSIVLWNTGLMSGIRRYSEMGIRLAMGESKGHVYRSLIAESILIGIIGSTLGTIIGLGFAYWMQEVGFDITGMIPSSSMMMSDVFRARITPPAFYLGFIPGLLATVIGSSIAGIGILRRQTSTLFKELEA